MINLNVRLATMNDVRDFCSILSAYPFDAQLTSGNDTVDAKSILGIFSLDLNGTTVLSVDSKSLLDLPEKLYKFLA